MLEWTGYAYLVFIVFSIALLFHPLLETNITFICISDIILNFFSNFIWRLWTPAMLSYCLCGFNQKKVRFLSSSEITPILTKTGFSVAVRNSSPWWRNSCIGWRLSLISHLHIVMQLCVLGILVYWSVVKFEFLFS